MWWVKPPVLQIYLLRLNGDLFPLLCSFNKVCSFCLPNSHLFRAAQVYRVLEKFMMVHQVLHVRSPVFPFDFTEEIRKM